VVISKGADLDIPFRCRLDGDIVPPENIAALEIYVGPYRKTYPGGGITLSGGYFLFPLSQQETFRIDNNVIVMTGRMKVVGSTHVTPIHFPAVRVEDYPGREII